MPPAPTRAMTVYCPRRVPGEMVTYPTSIPLETYTARENKSIAAGTHAPRRRQMLYNVAVTLAAASEVKYVPGVGPQRARILASRGIHSVGDLLAYLPFRYEDR